MPLFMPQDPPDSLGEFKPLGPAIRSQPKEEPVTLEKTGTPGIVRNSKTGKLETQLPEPQQKLGPLDTYVFPDLVILEENTTFTASVPRQQGKSYFKSLIQEMAKRYACHVRGDFLEDPVETHWMNWIKGK